MSSVAAANKPFDKYSVNPNHFINVTTPEEAYILGLLWADGHIQIREQNNYKHYRITLSTTSPDIDTFLPIFQKTGRWMVHYRKDPNPNHKKAYSISTTNRPAVEYLLQHSYKQKSWESADKIISKIPENLQHYWFRGLVDGDGCIDTKGRVSIYSGYNQDWTYMVNLCKKLNISYKIIKRLRKLGGSGEFHLHKRIHAKKFLDYIYLNAEIDKMYLERKRIRHLNGSDPRIKTLIRFNKEKNEFLAYGKPAALRKSTFLGSFKTKEQAEKARIEYIHSLTNQIDVEAGGIEPPSYKELIINGLQV